MELDLFYRPEGSFDSAYADEIRKKYLRTDLPSNLKMDIYNSCTKGETDKYIELVKSGKYPILEECSAAGYFWTGLHYACHYGHYDIIKYTVEHFKDNPEKIAIMSLQSNKGLTPYTIAISNCANYEMKRKILQLFVDNDMINPSLFNTDNKDIFELANQHKVLDILEPYMKED